MAQVGLAQHHADIGVGDEQAAVVHHIRRTGLADLDARDHVPDEFEIDLGNGHAGAAAGARHCQSKIGFRLLAKVDLAQVTLVGLRLDEFGLLAHVRAARGDIHGQPRYFDLLMALGIEIAHFRDRLRLPQQAQEVKPALIDAATCRQKTGGPPHLVLDLLDELFDNRRRTERLLVLDRAQSLAVLPIGVVHLDCGTDDERASDERHQQRGILAKQAALPHLRLAQLLRKRAHGRGNAFSKPTEMRGDTFQLVLHPMHEPRGIRHRSREGCFDACAHPRHSITSSARASTNGGTVRPSELAVLRLTMSWNLVGCSTGSSAGSAPLSILSTYPAARRKRSMTSTPYAANPPAATSSLKAYMAGSLLRAVNSMMLARLE